MRKITQLVSNAFIAGRDFTLGNSHVDYDADTFTRRMYLHGNLIAKQVGNELRVTLAGWPTPTTRERLNGLFESMNVASRIYQRGHVQYISSTYADEGTEREIHPHEWVRV